MADVRLIDANALEKRMSAKVKDLAEENGWHDHYTTGFDDALTYVEDAPAIDAVHVVHARWVHDINNLYGCSCCLERETMSHRKLKKYCPNCGAKMDAADNNVGHKD